MQNMKKFFGFEVKVSDLLHPEDFSFIKGRLINFASTERLDLDRYHVYLHQLVILADESHFGMGGGLPARVENIFLKFSVNQKQRRDGDIIFKNNLIEEETADILSYTLPHEICYTIPPSYFLRKQQFQNVIVTFVSKALRREDFKKIKVCVSANATQVFRPLIKTNLGADSITNIDLPFSKGIDFDKEIKLKLQRELGESEMGERSTTNIFNIHQAGAVSASGEITTNNNVNQSQQGIPVQHIVKEMRHLLAVIEHEGHPERENEGVEALSNAIASAESGGNFLPTLQSAGEWLIDKAEKVGVSLVSAAIKGELGL